MKITNTILAFFLMTGLSAQVRESIGKAFVMSQNFQVNKCSAFGEIEESKEVLERNFKIIVEAFTEKGYVVSVPIFTSSSRKDELNRKYVGLWAAEENGNRKDENVSKFYFFIANKDFQNVCTPEIPINSIVIGLPTIPTKLRFGNAGKTNDPRYFRFEGNLNLGLSVGWKHYYGSRKKYSHDLILGFTLSSIAVDSATTKGKINTSTSVSSFSPHLGFVMCINNFQLGIYSGIDFLNGETNTFWTYRNQPWLGIGIGFDLFNTENSNEKNKIQ